MKTFLNEELKQFKDLSDEEMLAIIKAKIAGTCEVKQLDEKWGCSVSDAVNINFIYRTKPPKQLVVPWEVLKKNIKHAAMDMDGRVFGYSEMDGKDDEYWFGLGEVGLSFLELDTSGIDWKTSHVTRPEGV